LFIGSYRHKADDFSGRRLYADYMYIFHLTSPGDRPPYYELAEHLWGVGCSIDSDGDSSNPDARDWTELTICLKASGSRRIDIDPVADSQPLVLSIRSEDKDLVHRAAIFLRDVTGGKLTKA
jgi:hypothetical protein